MYADYIGPKILNKLKNAVMVLWPSVKPRLRPVPDPYYHVIYHYMVVPMMTLFVSDSSASDRCSIDL
jgi:hypothetical protein